MVRLTLGHLVSTLFILSQKRLNSKPFLIYSAWSPHPSIEVNIINSFTLSSSSILFTFSINLSNKASCIPKLELIAKFNLRFGLGSLII